MSIKSTFLIFGETKDKENIDPLTGINVSVVTNNKKLYNSSSTIGANKKRSPLRDITPTTIVSSTSTSSRKIPLTSKKIKTNNNNTNILSKISISYGSFSDIKSIR